MSQDIAQPIRVFLLALHSAVRAKDADALRKLYEVDFNALTEAHFRETRWPAPEAVEAFYRASGKHLSIVVALYAELFWRYVCARFSSDMTWFERVASSNNYTVLFELLKKDCEPAANGGGLPLPLTWQWDMVDELVYQYQDSQRFRIGTWSELTMHVDLIEHMRKTSAAWRAPSILIILRGLVALAGNSLDSLKSQQPGRDTYGSSHYQAAHGAVAASSTNLPLRTTLGYFACISLARLLVSMGDYRGALVAASPIDIEPNALYWKVPAAHLTLVYNLAFAYMMSNRYDDAARLLVQLLSFLAHSQSYLQTAGYQQEPMQRMVERMYHLLFCCESLSPASGAYSRGDEAVALHMKHIGERLSRLDFEDSLAEAFQKGCPKFIDPMVFTYDPDQLQQLSSSTFDPNEASFRQQSVFRRACQSHSSSLDVHSIARLYNNFSVTKLANLMGLPAQSASDTVRSEMLAVKNRSISTVWKAGPLYAGQRVLLPHDLDVHLDLDTVYVTNQVSEKNQIESYIRQILKSCSEPVSSGAPQTYASRKPVRHFGPSLADEVLVKD